MTETNKIISLSLRQWNVVLNFSTDNRLMCDCDAIWLKEYIVTNRPYYASVFCAGPSSARGQRLISTSIGNCCEYVQH